MVIAMSYNDQYKENSIWGTKGPPHAYADGSDAAMKAKGADYTGNTYHHTEMWLAGYAEGQELYKKEMLTKLLKGEVGEDELTKEEREKILGKHKAKMSAGGILLI